ncbi:MAG: TonB-dependent receptor, partial [Novosphingobium sp.]
MRSIHLTALLGVSLLGLSAPALAQDEPPAVEPVADEGLDASEDLGRETIIVQARRKDESLQDVPLSVQAVTGNQLAKLELRSFQDVAAVVPGLQLSRASNGIQNTVTMRGVSFNPTATGPQTAVELYRNDIVTSSSAIFQALYDIQQLEVLRGPQGTLRGRASPSGSITITTKRPNLDEVGGFAEGTVAEHDKYVATGAINVPIVEGKLGVRVAGYVGGGQGNEIDRRAIGGRNAFDQVQSLRASVRADPFDGVLLLDANYETTSRKTASFEQYETAALSAADAARVVPGPVISSDDRVSVQAEPNRLIGTYKFYNWQAQLRQLGQVLTYVGGRLDAVSNAVAPEDPAGILRNPFAPSFTPDASGNFNVRQFAQFTQSEQHQRVHEIRLQNDERIAGIFDYVVGYLHLKQNTPTFLRTTTTTCAGVTATNPASVACPANGLASVTLGGTYRIRMDKEESFFGNLTVHLGDATEISGGVRRIKFNRISGLQSNPRGTGALAAFPVPDFPSIDLVRAQPESPVFAVDDGVKHTIYTLSAKHNFSRDLMVYATYGTSFRPGNILVCARCGTGAGSPDAVAAAPFLRPADETSRSIEGGFKASLFDRRVTANLSVFRQTFKNFTIGTTDPVQFLDLRSGETFGTATGPRLALGGTTNTLALAVPVRITGFEAELGFHPSERFNIAGNIAYSDSKVRNNGSLPCVDVNNDNFTDPLPIANTTAGATAFQNGITPAGGKIDTCLISSASPAPKWSAAAQGEYNHPFGESTEGFVRGLLSYFGKTNGDDVNGVDSVSAYSLLNLYAGLRDPDGAWEVSLFGKNLFETDRVLTRTAPVATSTIAGASFFSSYRRITTTSPREFGVTAKI